MPRRFLSSVIMTHVAGVDGAPGGWAVVIMEADRLVIRRVKDLAEIFDGATRPDLLAIDIPIGLLDTYVKGGRPCDRAARKILGRSRGSSVFPAPVRPVLAAVSYPEACAISRASGPTSKAISKQTFCILPKIREVDELLQTRPELRHVVREVHPEVCFRELARGPMVHKKSSALGRDERRRALTKDFPGLDMIESDGRAQDLKTEDILDATVACWSAFRLAAGRGHSLPEVALNDSTGMPMAIWV